MDEPEIKTKIRIQSYNPYESIYPGLRVVSHETLRLIKMLRDKGYDVVVEPNDGTKLHYTIEKGFGEILSDPILVYVIGIPTSILTGLFSAWLYDLLKRPSKPNEVNLIIEFDESGSKVRCTQSGQQISDKRFKSILSELQVRKRKFEESRKLVAPYPEYFFPISLEHTGKIVGWSKGLIFDDVNKEIRVDATKIIDQDTSERIKRGELKGFSIAGIVSSATCQVCGKEYVDCNHAAGCIYTILPAEISIVKDPVLSSARIEHDVEKPHK